VSVIRRQGFVKVFAAASLFAVLTLFASLGASTTRRAVWILLFVPAGVLGRQLSGPITESGSRAGWNFLSAALFACPSFLLMSWLVLSPSMTLERVAVAGLAATVVYALVVVLWNGLTSRGSRWRA
jgi:hypothetical protein